MAVPILPKLVSMLAKSAFDSIDTFRVFVVFLLGETLWLLSLHYTFLLQTIIARCSYSWDLPFEGACYCESR